MSHQSNLGHYTGRAPEKKQTSCRVSMTIAARLNHNTEEVPRAIAGGTQRVSLRNPATQYVAQAGTSHKLASSQNADSRLVPGVLVEVKAPRVIGQLSTSVKLHRLSWSNQRNHGPVAVRTNLRKLTRTTRHWSYTSFHAKGHTHGHFIAAGYPSLSGDAACNSLNATPCVCFDNIAPPLISSIVNLPSQLLRLV